MVATLLDILRQFVDALLQLRFGHAFRIDLGATAAGSSFFGHTLLLDAGQLGEPVAQGVKPHDTRLQLTELECQRIKMFLRIVKGEIEGIWKQVLDALVLAVSLWQNECERQYNRQADNCGQQQQRLGQRQRPGFCHVVRDENNIHSFPFGRFHGMRRLNALFTNDAGLMALYDHADSLTVMQKVWAEVCPDSLKPLTRSGALNQGTLTVYTDHGAVGAKIKLLLPGLLAKLQKRGIEVTAIRVQVQVKSEPRKKPKIQRKISPQSASRLASLASELEGSELGEALARLSRRT